MNALAAAPGDVLAVWDGDGPGAELIRLDALLEGKPAVANHVVIVTHQDQVGRWMGIQGQPGGVGPVDCTPYLSDARTRSNNAQPRLDDHAQLATFLASAAKSLGIAYDWVAIGENALQALHVQDLSKEIDPLWRWPSDHNRCPVTWCVPVSPRCSTTCPRSGGHTPTSARNASAPRPTGGNGRTPNPGDNQR